MIVPWEGALEGEGGDLLIVACGLPLRQTFRRQAVGTHDAVGRNSNLANPQLSTPVAQTAISCGKIAASIGNYGWGSATTNV